MKFFIKKLITLIITLLVISFLTFTAFSVIPGDAALSRLGKDATEEQLERARDEMGLNDPLLERYGRWVSDAMQGDFGESYRYEGTSVRSLLAQRLPGHGASGSYLPAHHHGDFSSTRNPECPVCREMGRYVDELPDADSDGGAVVLSRHDPDLRVWTDSSYVPAG